MCGILMLYEMNFMHWCLKIKIGKFYPFKNIDLKDTMYKIKIKKHNIAFLVQKIIVEKYSSWLF